MKRLIITLAVAVSLFIGVLIMWSPESDRTPTDLSDNTDDGIINSGENFIVTELNDAGSTKFQYTIVDRTGRIVEQALCNYEPKIVQKSENMIGVRFTTENYRFYRYYNLSTNEISASFKNAFWDNGTLVAYYEHNNGLKFTVCPIFGNGYTCTVPAYTTFWNVSIVSAETNGDNTELVVTYVSGDSNEETPEKYYVCIPLTVMVEQYMNE